MKTFAYILSPSYSGSTLLTFLLAQHRDIATIGELKASAAMGDVSQYVCSCGERIVQCSFWRELKQTLAQRDVPFEVDDFGTHFRESGNPLADRVLRARVRAPAFEMARTVARTVVPAARKKHASALRRNRIIAETICELRGASVFLDGSKEAVRLEYLRSAGMPRLRVIYLVRDGRAVANSTRRHDNVSIEFAATEWKRTNIECERVAQRLAPGELMRLRYEDFCSDVPGTLSKMWSFLEIDPARFQPHFANVEHHILGNWMRLTFDGTVKLDEKWRAAMSAADLAAFDAVAGEMNRGFGYST
ncbi:MAG: sulfotransferase [Phycisphaerae bacterium]|nr:sulfotransferase [Phycisphaerae bacterium]